MVACDFKDRCSLGKFSFWRYPTKRKAPSHSFELQSQSTSHPAMARLPIMMPETEHDTVQIGQESEVDYSEALPKGLGKRDERKMQTEM